MLVIRPIETSDFEALLDCAKQSGVGFTSLPQDASYLKQKLDTAVQTFTSSDPQSIKQGLYFFVAEDLQKKCVVGTCAIDPAVGLQTPFYHYHLSTIVHHSPKLDVYNPVQILILNNDYTGKTELCSLFLSEPYRIGYNGRLLSKSRFLFLKNFSHLFHHTIFAEMRGIVDEQGNSPFWTWLEQHFFTLDFHTADHLTGIGYKRFISDLMPKYPIYVNLLSKQARQAIGKTHQQTTPALKMLIAEGFTYRNYIDIFDGGPTVECDLDHILSIRASELAEVEVKQISTQQHLLISNLHFSEFRAVCVPGTFDTTTKQVFIASEAAQALQVKPGSSVRVMEV